MCSVVVTADDPVLERAELWRRSRAAFAALDPHALTEEENDVVAGFCRQMARYAYSVTPTSFEGLLALVEIMKAEDADYLHDHELGRRVSVVLASVETLVVAATGARSRSVRRRGRAVDVKSTLSVRSLTVPTLVGTITPVPHAARVSGPCRSDCAATVPV